MKTIRPTLPLALCALPVVLILGCSGGASPTAPTASLSLVSANVTVAGQTVNGMTLPRGHGEGSSTRFEAMLTDDRGPLTGQTAQVRYERPQGMGMMNSSGTMMLYDDGTHGDRRAGDGLYCYEDQAGEYGCHSADSPMGEYHYNFFGMDGGGNHSNHMQVTVTIR